MYLVTTSRLQKSIGVSCRKLVLFSYLCLASLFAIPVLAHGQPSPKFESLDFEFSVQNVVISTDGKFAIVSGSETGVRGGIAVIDLEEMATVAVRNFDEPILRAAIGSEAGGYPIFVLLGKTLPRKTTIQKLLQLDSRELSTVLHIETTAPDLIGVIGNELVVLSSEVLKLPGLKTDKSRSEVWKGKKVGDPPLGWALRNHLYYDNLRRLTQFEHEYQIFDGVVWDKKLEEAKFMIAGGRFLGALAKPGYSYYWGVQIEKFSGDLTQYSVEPDKMRRGDEFKIRLQRQAKKSVFTGRPLSNYSSRTPGKNRTTGKTQIVLSAAPVAVRISHNTAEDANSTVCLTLHSLLDQKEVKRIEIGNFSSPYDYKKARLYHNGKHILLTHRNEIYDIPTNRLELPKLKKPFRLDRSQKTFVLPEKRSARLKYVTKDGKPPYKAIFYSGNKVYAQSNGETVDFEINSFELYDKERANALRRGSNNLEEYLQSTGDHFQRITKRKLKGIPVFVPATVRVIDAEGKIALLNHGFLVELEKNIYEQAAILGEPNRSVARGKERQVDNAALRKLKLTLAPIKDRANDKLNVLKRRKWKRQNPESMDSKMTLPVASEDLKVSGFKTGLGRDRSVIFSPDGETGFVIQKKISLERLLTRFDSDTFNSSVCVEPDFRPEVVQWSGKQLILQGRASDSFQYQDSKGRWIDVPDNMSFPKGSKDRVKRFRNCWLVDPVKLQPLKGFRLPGFSFRFSQSSTKAIAFPDLQTMELFDLKKGVRIGRYEWKKIAETMSKGLKSKVAADFAKQCELVGNGSEILFCASLAKENQLVLCRCKIDRKGNMTVDSFSDPFDVGRNYRGLLDLFSVSPDQKFAAVGFELPRPLGGGMGIGALHSRIEARGIPRKGSTKGDGAGTNATTARVIGKDGVLGTSRNNNYGIHVFDLNALGYPVATFRLNNGGGAKLSVAWDEDRKLLGICGDRTVHIVGGGKVRTFTVPVHRVGQFIAKQMTSIPRGFFAHGFADSLLLEPTFRFEKWNFGGASN